MSLAPFEALCTFPFTNLGGGTLIIPILQTKKPRFRKVRSPARGPTAGERKGPGFEPRQPDSRPPLATASTAGK